MSATSTVTIHGKSWESSHVQEEIAYCRTVTWARAKWKPHAALVDKKSGTSSPYLGRSYDAQHFQIIAGGWKHDHCEICWWTLHESEDEEEGTGYTNGSGNWVCIECFQQFIGKNENGA